MNKKRYKIESKHEIVCNQTEDLILNYFLSLESKDTHTLIEKIRQKDIGKFFALKNIFINEGVWISTIRKEQLNRTISFLRFILKKRDNVWSEHLITYYGKKLSTKELTPILLNYAKSNKALSIQRLFNATLRCYDLLLALNIVLKENEKDHTKAFEIIKSFDYIPVIPELSGKNDLPWGENFKEPVCLYGINKKTLDILPMKITNFRTRSRKNKKEYKVILHGHHELAPYIDISQDYNTFINTFDIASFKQLFAQVSDLSTKEYYPKQNCRICNRIKSKNSEIETAYCESCKILMLYLESNNIILEASIKTQLAREENNNTQSIPSQNVTKEDVDKNADAARVTEAMKKYLITKSIPDSLAKSSVSNDVMNLLRLSFDYYIEN